MYYIILYYVLRPNLCRYENALFLFLILIQPVDKISPLETKKQIQ